MTTLLLNAAEGRVQFALADGGTLLLTEDLAAPSRGTELLPPALHEALTRLELTPADVQRIACVRGPGSFTGLRLTLAFAAALRRATGASLAGINLLQALAASLPDLTGLPGVPTRCRVLTHARRDLVHAQDFRIFSGRTEQNGMPLAALPEPDGLYREPAMVELKNVLNELDAPAFLLGSGLDRNREALHKAALGAGLFPLYGLTQPNPAALLRLAESAAWGQADLEPLYLRPCDAVDNLPHIARKRGDDPAAVCARLNELLTPQAQL